MKEKLLICLSLIGSASSCTYHSQSLDSKDLTGKWIARKVINYNEGKETTVYPLESGTGNIAGSKTEPHIIEFTKYQEVIVSDLFNKKNLFQYKLIGDSLCLDDFGKSHISKIGKDTLCTVTEIKTNWFDKSAAHGKWIITFYYTR